MKLARRALLVTVVAAAFSGGVGYVLLFDNPRPRLIETHDYGRSWVVVRRWG